MTAERGKISFSLRGKIAGWAPCLLSSTKWLDMKSYTNRELYLAAYIYIYIYVNSTAIIEKEAKVWECGAWMERENGMAECDAAPF